METKELCERIKNILEDKKAADIEVLDIREITIIADYFIIASGTSTTHIKTLCDEVTKKTDERPLRIEGYSAAKWILIDFGSVIVHIFDTETRSFYSLEKLWADANQIGGRDEL